jgi:hypothetical protein
MTGDQPTLLQRGAAFTGEMLPAIGGEEALLASKGLQSLSPLVRRMLASGTMTGAQSAALAPDNKIQASGLGAATGAGISGLTGLAGKLSPLLGMPLRAGIGGGLGYEVGGERGAEIGAGIGALAPYAIPKLQEIAAKKSAVEGVDLAAAQPKLEAARRLGLSYLTPAEATGSPFVGAFQGSVGRTGEGSKLMYEKSQERLGSERQAINKLFNTIYDEEKLGPKMSEAYKSSYVNNVEPEFLNNLKQSNIIQSAFKKVQNVPAYKDALKNVPENNFAYLDQVKRALNDMSDSAFSKGNKNESRLINKEITKLTDQMDTISPEYAQARSLANREILLDKMKSKLNEADVKGTNFFNKFLKNDYAFEDIQRKLKDVPEARQKMDDMRLVFRDLINPQTARTGAALSKTSMTEGRSTGQFIKDTIAKLNGRRYDKSAIEILTNPRWDNQFRDVMGIKDKGERAISFANLLSKISASGIADELNKQGK